LLDDSETLCDGLVTLFLCGFLGWAVSVSWYRSESGKEHMTYADDFLDFSCASGRCRYGGGGCGDGDAEVGCMSDIPT
jgi:hypothetical protein